MHLHDEHSNSARTSNPAAAERALPAVLMGMTLLSGMIDAVSYLGLGGLYLGKMTGNVVQLGMATGQAAEFSAGAVLALLSFLSGAVFGGRLYNSTGRNRTRWVRTALLVETLSLAAASALALSLPVGDEVNRAFALTGLMAFAMGFRNATVRKLGVPDMTTTLVTLTLADLASDSFLAGRRNPRLGRRLGVVLALFSGSLIGGALIVLRGISTALLACCAVAVVLTTAYSIAARRSAKSEPVREIPVPRPPAGPVRDERIEEAACDRT